MSCKYQDRQFQIGKMLKQISLDELLKGDDKMIEHLNESTNIVSSNKKLICVAIINIILFFGLVIFNTIISNNKYLLASVLVIAMCSIAALFYQVIKKFRRKENEMV